MNSRVLRHPVFDAERRAIGPASTPVAVPTSSPALSDRAIATMPSAAPSVPLLALEAGREEGLRQGLADAQARIEREIDARWQAQKAQWEQAERRRAEEHAQRLATLDNVLQTVQKAMPERFLALERQAIGLAYEALCRVCGPHAEQEPGTDRAGLLVDLLRQGVHQLRGQAWLAVRLNPRDLAALTGHEAGRSFVERHPEVRFAPDATLEPLSALLETDHGQLDASLATQLSRLRELWSQSGDDAGAQETR